MTSFLMLETPLAVTRFVLPPASVLVIILACSPVHFPHAACIFCSSGCRIAGSVFAQSAITEAGTRYRTRNFCLVASVMVFPSLGGLVLDEPQGRSHLTPADMAHRFFAK